ncbi:MAG: hypothetical protein H8E22_04535 [Candidatus Cloacimonetes bacterium]|nr:hypothetical protein [Candidatus Cloacimonadota bacterium]
MKKISDMDMKELAAYVATHLRKSGIDVVLTGGGCVSIYSHNKYVSGDLDFIIQNFVTRSEVKASLSKIRFFEENRYFKHSETHIIIEFPPGPLSIGSEAIRDIIVLHTDCGDLRIISPTESVKDRLAAYYFWNDLQCLEQAILIARFNKIEIKEIKRWSRIEGEEKKFNVFINKLEGNDK